MNNGLAFRAIGPAGQLLVTRLMTGDSQIRPADRAILDSVCVVFSNMRLRIHQGASERPVDLLLTPREAECLRWAGHGLTDPEVADLLGISRRTVGVHVENARRKLGARTRLAAFSRAQELGLLAR
jgi:LuxR family quorum sensing-dependent transcriptional regulator